MPEPEPTFDVGGVHGAWDPTRRRLRVRHRLGSTPGEADALRIRPILDAWVGDGPCDMLVDAEGAGGATLGWRLAWNRWFYDHRDRLRVAVYHATRLDRNLIPVFSALTGVPIRTFPSREDAEAWLDGRLPADAEGARADAGEG